jgi:uncharacterized protein
MKSMVTDTDLLADYRKLIEKVDALCATITRNHAADIACRKGCCDCCRHFSIFWVEACALAEAIGKLPVTEALALRQHAAAAEGAVCPLLQEGACVLYQHRPIICRTHGLPILVDQTDTQLVDFCPRNFLSSETLPGTAIINLDRLNAALAAINRVFIRRRFPDGQPTVERLSLAEAVALACAARTDLAEE